MHNFLVWISRDPTRQIKIKAISLIAARELGADILRAPRWEIAAKNLDEEKERRKNQKYPWVDPPYWSPRHNPDEEIRRLEREALYDPSTQQCLARARERLNQHCSRCKKIIDEGDGITFRNKPYCLTCYQEWMPCDGYEDFCDREAYDWKTRETDDKVWCEKCYQKAVDDASYEALVDNSYSDYDDYDYDYQRNPDAHLRELERQLMSNPGDYQAWKALVTAYRRTGEPLVVTFFASRGAPEWKRRWVSQEIYDVNSIGRYQYLHLLPRGFPYSQFTNYKGARAESPGWSSNGSLFTADKLHFGLMTLEEEQANQELIAEQQQIEDDRLDAFESSMW